MGARRWVVSLERAWDATRLRRAGTRLPADFRIEPYLGHAGPEGWWYAAGSSTTRRLRTRSRARGRRRVRRTLRHFVTDELPGVPLRVAVAGETVETATDAEATSSHASTRTPLAS